MPGSATIRCIASRVTTLLSRRERTRCSEILPHAIRARLLLNTVSHCGQTVHPTTEAASHAWTQTTHTPSHLTFRLLHRSQAAITRSTLRLFSGRTTASVVISMKKSWCCRIGRSPVTFQKGRVGSSGVSDAVIGKHRLRCSARADRAMCPPMKNGPATCHAALYTARFRSHWTMAAADDSCWRQCAAVIRPLQSTLLHPYCRCRKVDCTGV